MNQAPRRESDRHVPTTWLTVNKRLAAECRRDYDARHRAQELAVWPSADILPWEAWLVRLYQQLLDDGYTRLDLLNPQQERLVWQQVIEQASDGRELLRPGAAALGAQKAAQLYADWQLHKHPLSTLGSEETQTFLGWQRAFEQTLAKRDQLARSQLIPLLTSAFAENRLPLPARLRLSGFDVLAPAQLALLAQLAEQGCELQYDRDESTIATGRRVEAADREAEITLAARWAAQRLEASPDARIGIVVPQLAQYQADLQRLFTAHIVPGQFLLFESGQSVFNISLGSPLSARPPVAAALDLLDLAAQPIALSQVGQILRSPFVGGHASECDDRARLDAALRDHGMPTLGLTGLRTRLQHFSAQDARRCADLQQRLQKLEDLARQQPLRAAPGTWAGHLQALLKTMGWPGDQALDSAEYQAVERFRRLLSEFATLDKVRPTLAQREAVRLLRSLAHDTVFQPESIAARVQILGPLEAVGMSFDAIWLLGVDDQTWPPAPQPDPLLPYGLQRELGMPHASAERELAFARALTARLACGCDCLIASHARNDGEREQRPSALIHDWPLLANDALPPAADMSAAHAACADARERVPLPPASATPAGRELPGGASLIAAQAACPFKAVARFRLGAIPLAEASHAPDGADSGTLVHELLQRVWQQLGGSDKLSRLDDAALRDLVLPLARATIADHGRRRPDLFGDRFAALEADRLTDLLIAWLQVERSRDQAFDVAALERKESITLGRLQLSTRIDRIDRLADDSLAIIDYKTARDVRHASWFDPRPGEPQLPLYCVQQGEQVAAALLARVRRDGKGCRFVGVSREPGFAPGVEVAGDGDSPEWPQIMAHWQRALGELADEISSGRADPTPTLQACQYCELGALCRVRNRFDENDNG
ncbi:MAG: PD-(D/E)XK nuclease family protein [Gammaproteobacteria bacterium]|nr:PD-(D/E)XK nuclease family protein [Gammaproteobacteria bacterium]